MASFPAVFRRVVFIIGDTRIVHEAAVDFTLVDGSGESIIVMIKDARLITAEPNFRKLTGEDADRVRALPYEAVANIRKGHSRWIRASEVLICDGQEVEIVGYKTRTVDPGMSNRLARETPMRATLRGGKALPLLIAPARARDLDKDGRALGKG